VVLVHRQVGGERLVGPDGGQPLLGPHRQPAGLQLPHAGLVHLLGGQAGEREPTAGWWPARQLPTREPPARRPPAREPTVRQLLAREAAGWSASRPGHDGAPGRVSRCNAWAAAVFRWA